MPAKAKTLERIKTVLTSAARSLVQVLSLDRRLEELRRDHDASTEWLRKNHDELVAWQRQTYPELVAAIEKRLEKDRFDAFRLEFEHQTLPRIFEVIHSELEALRPAPVPQGANEEPLTRHVAQVAVTDTDSRFAGFYQALERGFRGTPEQVSEKLEQYFHLADEGITIQGPALDLGCGRGEWLELLRTHGIASQGVDINAVGANYCQARGLEVTRTDALEFLSGVPNGSFGLVTAFHLVEHLPFNTLLSLTSEIQRVLKPGGLVILETPNPENLMVATKTFWYDPTHLRILPPELLQFLVTHVGFVDVRIKRLHPAECHETADPLLRQMLSAPRDYAILATKPPHDHPTSAPASK